jgi:hypothetical protein
MSTTPILNELTLSGTYMLPAKGAHAITCAHGDEATIMFNSASRSSTRTLLQESCAPDCRRAIALGSRPHADHSRKAGRSGFHAANVLYQLL